MGLLALTVAGVLAGIINVVAGGGSLLTMPLLVFLGLSGGHANATARVAILVQNVTATLRYHRAGHVDWVLTRRLALPAIVGCAGGSVIALRLGDVGFRVLLSIVMLVCAVLVVARPPVRAGTDEPLEPTCTPLRVFLAGGVIGLYGGLVQVGVGYLILFLFSFVLRLPLFTANVLKVAIVLCYTPIALAVFVSQGLVVLVPAVVLAAGQAAGAWIGASLALERGAGLIRTLLALVIVASAAQLLADLLGWW